MPSTKLLAAGIAALVAVAGVVHWGRAASAEPPDEHVRRPLVAMSTAGRLTPAYSLAVVPVPPPPGVTGGAVDANGCPVEVRAVVEGEHPEDSFAVVTVNGASQVLKMGQSLVVAGERFVIRDVGAQQFTLQRGDVVVRCALANSTR